MSALKKGIDQVSNYVEVLKALDRIKQIEISNYTILAMVLTHKPLPIPVPLTDLVRISDSTSFLDLLNNNFNKSLIAFFDSFIPIQSSATQFDPIDDSIAVEDWKIVRKMFKRKL
jgi:hypothetical protein